MKSFENNLNKAILLRGHMKLNSNALRLINGLGDGLDGLLIDRYHRHVQVQLLSLHWQEKINEIVRILTLAMPIDYLIVKTRQGLEIKQEVLIGSQAQTIVEENGINFEVNLNDGLNCGLFLDMRRNRWLISQACRGKKVLNCFAYTCSFGVYARHAGAREVINTDISRKILEKGKNNFKINSLPLIDGEFIKADSVSFLQRAFKKRNTFDVIILDPPSFARHEGKVFQVKRDLPKLIALAVAVLNPAGFLLVTTNYSEISHADLERILSKGLNGRHVAQIQRVGQDEDFLGSNSFKESFLVGLWVKFL